MYQNINLSIFFSSYFNLFIYFFYHYRLCFFVSTDDISCSVKSQVKHSFVRSRIDIVTVRQTLATNLTPHRTLDKKKRKIIYILYSILIVYKKKKEKLIPLTALGIGEILATALSLDFGNLLSRDCIDRKMQILYNRVLLRNFRSVIRREESSKPIRE